MFPRRETRFKPNQTATVTVLGMRPGPVLQTCVLDISGSGMRVRSRLPVPLGASISVEIENNVSHGSICRCEQDGDSFELGIQVAETAPAAQFLERS